MAFSFSRPKKRVQICLDGSLIARAQELTDQADVLRQKSVVDDRFKRDLSKVHREMRENRDAFDKASIYVIVQGLKRSVWEAFIAEHPKREGQQLDDAFGFNTDTLFPAVIMNTETPSIIQILDHEGLVQPFTPEELTELVDEMTKSQYEEICLAVYAVNGQVQTVPFSPTAFAATKSSAEK